MGVFKGAANFQNGLVANGVFSRIGFPKGPQTANMTHRRFKPFFKILNFRIFSDENLKMNKSIIDVSGEILIVSQFTLAGKFLKGNRPSFVNAKSSEIAEEMILKIVEEFSKYVPVKTGSFGAMMDVGLINDGPATFVLTARNGQLIDQAD